MAEGTRNIQTLTGLSSTNGFPLWFPDVLNNPFNLGIGVAVNSTATTPSWNMEAAFGFTGTSAWISSNDTWFQLSGLASNSSNATGNVAFPCAALRLNVTAGASQQTITATVIQSGA
jgi:hypothetical protein